MNDFDFEMLPNGLCFRIDLVVYNLGEDFKFALRQKNSNLVNDDGFVENAPTTNVSFSILTFIH